MSVSESSYRECANLATMFFDRAARQGDAPFLWAKHEDAYRPTTWREAAESVSELARGLHALGIQPSDRVALISENRPEWAIAEIAIMAAGAIAVPAYTTNTVEDHLHILTNTGAKAAIVSTRRLSKNLIAAATQAPSVSSVITIEAPHVSQDPGVDLYRWGDVLARGRAADEDIVAEAARLTRDRPCCIIHTSGTGGTPKGVTLSHGAIICNCMGAYHVLKALGLGNEVFLSFLPLSHSYEHAAGLHFPISIGAQIYYAEGVETLATNMIEARPTIMTAVPRLYELMHGRITAGVRRTGGLKEKLFLRALALGTKRYHDPRSLTAGERVIDAVLDRLVREKVRARFGGRLKALVSGGAPLNVDIGIFFTALGMRLLQGYGQTESAPVVSCNPPARVKMHTVGPPLVDVEVKIAEDGEILVKGELVMEGYWNEPEATANAVRDGWLHTGDIGLIDADGYIQITDRKKDIIVNSGGDNISPQRIEGFLTLQPELAQAMVCGDRRPYLVAALVPDPEFLETWAAANGKSGELAALADDADLRGALGEAVARVNEGLSQIERVRRFLVAGEAFTIENGMLTPTLKIRRHVIGEVYGKALEGLYEAKQAAS